MTQVFSEQSNALSNEAPKSSTKRKRYKLRKMPFLQWVVSTKWFNSAVFISSIHDRLDMRELLIIKLFFGGCRAHERKCAASQGPLPSSLILSLSREGTSTAILLKKMLEDITVYHKAVFLNFKIIECGSPKCTTTIYNYNVRKLPF